MLILKILFLVDKRLLAVTVSICTKTD